MKKGKKSPVIRYIVLILLAAIIGVNIFSLNATRLAGDALPMPFGYGAAVVLSGSMEPTIMVDELIIVKETQQYAVGDVVVFQTGTIPVVHRIVALDDQQVTTRGDANNVDDEPMELSRLKGKVIGHIPYIGILVRLLKTPVATIALILAAVLLLELSFHKDKDEKDEELERIKEEIRLLKDQQEE